MNIKYCDFGLAPKTLKERWSSAINEVIESGIFIGGPQKKLFETRFAEMIGSEFALGVSNGLDGLVLGLRALGAKSDSTVAVPEHTFIATWNAVGIVGATPISVEIGPDGLIDLGKLERLEPAPNFVIPVHMHGSVVDMNRLMSWAKIKNVKVIEDASQAHFGIIQNKYVGTFSDIGVFSLYPTKNLGALGDAGIMVTNDEKNFKILNSLSNYGTADNSKYKHELMGFNSRLDELQAAVLNVNLDYIHDWNAKRIELAELYKSKFKDSSINFLDQQNSIFHHFIIFSKTREKLRASLYEHGIGTEIHYPFLASQEYERFNGVSTSIPSSFAIKMSEEGLSLPLHQWMNPKSIEIVADTVLKIGKQL